MVDFIQYFIYAILTSISFYITAKNLDLFKVNKQIDCINVGILTAVTMSVLMSGVSQTVIYVIVLLIILIYFNNGYKLDKSNLSRIAITVVILIICDNIVGASIVYGIGVPYEEFKYGRNAILYAITTTTIIIPLAYIISKNVIRSYRKLKFKIDSAFNNKEGINITKLLIINISILIISVIVTNIITKIEVLNQENIITIYATSIFLYSIVMVITTVIIVKTYNQHIKIMRKENELNNLVEYNSTLETLYSDMRNFKHDYLNILSTLSSFIEEQNYDGLKEYFNDNIVAYTEKMNSNNHKIGSLRNLKINSIKGLVFSKYIKAQEANIDLEIEILEDIEKINIEEIDFARCLGIIIDNAIEATIESKDKRVTVAFINGQNGVIVVIKNAINENIPPLYKLMEEGFSTKGEKRGIGLSNFNQILSKYPNVNKDINIENNEFIVTIECRE